MSRKEKDQGRRGMSDLERLQLRVSAMIQSPRAQALRRTTIWRVESDTDQAWSQLLEDLREVDGLELEKNEDGTVTLSWEEMPDEGPEIEAEEMEVVPDMIVQRLHEEPALF